MPSYVSLLVLLLAASTVTPVLSAEPPEVEGRPPTHVEPVKRFAFKRPSIMTTIKALLVAGLITYSVKEWKPKPKNPQTSGTPSTNATQPTSGTPSTNGTQPISGTQPAYNGTSINTAELPSSTPTTVSGRNARREERPLGRRSRVDISKARSFSEDIRRTSSHEDLLSRADLGEALGLFGRMLDKLD